MKKLIYAAAAMIAAFAQMNAQERDWAQFGRYAEDNKTVPEKPKAVFMGDSITDLWINADPGFFSDNNFIDRGISGQTSSEMLVRFRQDVIELGPEYAVIMAGTNDIARNNGRIELKNVLDNLISMCELARANGIKPVLCSVPPTKKFGWRPELTPAQDVVKLNGMIKDYAARAGIQYVDYHSALKDAENGLPAEYSGDGVHPNKEGYKVMKNIVLKYIK